MHTDAPARHVGRLTVEIAQQHALSGEGEGAYPARLGMKAAHCDSLREWLSRHGAVISDAIAARSIPSMGGGRGIVALEDLGAGQLVVAVPSRCMVTTKSARRYLQGLKPPPSGLADLSPEEIIASFLVLAERDPSNMFYEWLRALPRSYDNLLELPYPTHIGRADSDEEQDATPGELAVEESETLARAAAYESAIESFVWSPRMRNKCVTERLRFESSAERCLSRIPQLRARSMTHAVFEDEGTSSDELGMKCSAEDHHATSTNSRGLRCAVVEKLLWGYNSLMSRGFAYDEETWAMMPWVDYFNYDLYNNVTMRYDPRRMRYEFITIRPLRCGEQLMLQYGRYSDFELALWYGFTLRRALFPKWFPKRQTHERRDEEKEGAADHEVVQLNTHMAYVFSPTYEPNGDLPLGIQWAVDLAVQAGLAYPPSWDASNEAGTQHDPGLHDVRVCWGCVSSGMKYFVHLLVLEAKGSLSGEEALQRLATSELRLLKSGQKSVAQSGVPISTAVRMARDLSDDHVTLLKKYSEMSREQLLGLLVAAT